MSESHPPDTALDLWWAIPGVLAGMSMPFIHPRRFGNPGALEDSPDELPALWRADIRAVVSLLNMPAAANAYTTAGFAFQLLPVPDGAAPTLEQFQRFLTFTASQHAMGRAVVVH